MINSWRIVFSCWSKSDLYLSHHIPDEYSFVFFFVFLFLLLFLNILFKAFFLQFKSLCSQICSTQIKAFSFLSNRFSYIINNKKIIFCLEQNSRFGSFQIYERKGRQHSIDLKLLLDWQKGFWVIDLYRAISLFCAWMLKIREIFIADKSIVY